MSWDDRLKHLAPWAILLIAMGLLSWKPELWANQGFVLIVGGAAIAARAPNG